MKILFVGGLDPSQTSLMRMRVLERLGHEVKGVDAFARWNRVSPWTRRAQQWLCAGSIVDSLNRDVLEAARSFSPDLVWAEKQEYLRADTFATLKQNGARLLHFSPDPYFALDWKRTRLMDDALPLLDYVVTSKKYEMNDYNRLPAKLIYMPLGFGEAAHRPVVPASREMFARYSSDVSFLGGWEPRREQLLDAVSRLPDIDLKVWGYGWDHLRDGRLTPRRFFAMRRNSGGTKFKVRRNEGLARRIQGSEVYGDEYAWAISGARVSLGFLRTICPDQHTTRTFEIPACGSMLLADRTAEHQEFFEEGVEAEFFASESELLDKLRYYLENEGARSRIALRGYERCFRGGYSYRERMTKVLESLER